MMRIVKGFNPYVSVSLDTFYRILSHTFSGDLRWREIYETVSVESVKNMFPHYRPLKKVRGYHAKRCTIPLVALFMYPCWLAAHHMWP